MLVVGCAQGLLELVLKGDYALELPEKPCKCARGKATGNRGDRTQTGVSEAYPPVKRRSLPLPPPLRQRRREGVLLIYRARGLRVACPRL